MWKTIPLGGIKLLNVRLKSRVSKVKWLIELASDHNLRLHLDIFTSLLGTQKGKISGKDLIFLEKSYFQKQLKTESKFYNEALLAMADFQTTKGILNINCWDKEHIYYNPLFRTAPEGDDKEEGKL